MATIEDTLKDLNGKDGGDWEGTLTGAEFLAAISRVALRNNGLLVEVTLPNGDSGVYRIADAPVADKFLSLPA